MKRVRGHLQTKIFVASLLVLAMALIGFAHRAGLSAADARLAAYVSAGGAVSDLCDFEGHRPLAPGKACDACRLVGAADLPGIAPVSKRAFGAQAHRMNVAPVALTIGHVRDPSIKARAPPSVVSS